MSNIDLDIKNTSEEHIIERHKRRGIYLFPNIITTAGLFAGFYAIVAAMKANFELACMALFAAAVLDNLDGRVARLTGTQSAFGAQYDSLSDMVCFGMTPALMAYSWGLQYLGKIGWLVAFMYVAATGLRLARFNLSENQNSDKKFFIGLPCTSAAAVIAGMVWVGTDFDIPGKTISEIAALVVMALSLLMVSNLRYHSFKEVDLKGNVPFITIFLVVFIYALIAWDPPKILFSIFFLYMLSGLFGFFRRKLPSSKQNQSKIIAIK
ncbi:MAG: CDP-diacylglycerol--serine O-phosphatidyltransferase [Gammaproteobacteria bacterium]|jgi:CDP-diacylglycerol--serine O-phosphatidyltransferase